MNHIRVNNLLIIFSALFLTGFVFADRNFKYNSIGVRDPMIKPISIIKTTINQEITKKKAEKQTRHIELQKIISRTKIEGVVFGEDNKPLVMIDNKIIAEGDRISKKSNVYVRKIELRKIIFSLDNETVTYVLTSLKKDSEP